MAGAAKAFVSMLLTFASSGLLSVNVIYNGIAGVGICYIILVIFGMKDVIKTKDFDIRR